MAHGVFDVLHPGHLHHLRQARALGTRLIVGVTADEHVNKGPGRPYMAAEHRVEMLNALEVVDHAFIVEGNSAVEAIQSHRPSVFAKGADYAGGRDLAGHLEDERKAVEALGGELVFTDGIAMSSTAIINQVAPRVSTAAQEWLSEFNTRHTEEEILGWLSRAQSQTVAVVGEAIEDVYQYVDALYRSAKESVISWEVRRTDEFRGGIWMVAEHMGAVSNSVEFCPDPELAVRKTRYVEQPHNRKVFELLHNGVVPAWANRPLDFDLTVVVDYGHGLIPDSGIAMNVIQSSHWLALTVQSNSANWGFNTLAKWASADYFVVDRPELWLSVRQHRADEQTALSQEFKRLGADVGVVTLGHEGAMLTDGDQTIVVPSMSDHVVDRIGAGDAFLAITAPLVRAGAPLDVIGMVGNVAGALQVGRIGNSQAIGRSELRQWVTSLMK
jgi:cytidyltransferase-like protein